MLVPRLLRNFREAVLALVDPSGAQIAAKTYLLTTAQGDSITASAQAMGWYTFTVRSFNTPAGNQKPSYKLTATYTAPQVLTWLEVHTLAFAVCFSHLLAGPFCYSWVGAEVDRLGTATKVCTSAFKWRLLLNTFNNSNKAMAVG